MGTVPLTRKQPPVTKEGWRAFAQSEPPERPERLSFADYQALAPSGRQEYNRARFDDLGRLGPYKLGYVRRVLDAADELLAANDRLAEDRVRPGIIIDGEPTLGKTTVLRQIGRRYDRQMRSRYGHYVDDGHEYLPVCHVALSEDSSVKALNQKIAAFYGVPFRPRESANDLSLRIREHMYLCATSLVLVDDLHFVNPRELNGRKLNDHLKSLASEIAATFIYAGVGLEEAGFLQEGRGAGQRRLAQISGRMRHFLIQPFEIDSKEGLKEWRQVVATIEHDLRFLGRAPGLAVGDTPAYLHARTRGSIGDLVELIRVAGGRVVERERSSGEPSTLDRKDLEEVRLSHRSEQGRRDGVAKASRSAGRKQAA